MKKMKTMLVIAGLVAGVLVVAARGDAQTNAPNNGAGWSGGRLEEFRQLARDVEVTAIRAHTVAKRDVKSFPDRGGQFVGELNYLVARSRDLQVLSVGANVSPLQAGPMVDRLIKDARQVDRGMREAGVFGSVWGDSSGTITALERMASLARS